MSSLAVLKRKISTFLNQPETLKFKLVDHFSRFLPDRLYLKIQFQRFLGYKLNLKNPQSFNEKLNWLKLYYHNPIQTELVDKVRVKKYVAKLIGDKYIIPTIGVWDTFDNIDFKELPNQFVLKTNHDYGGVIICKDKKEFNYAMARTKLNKHLSQNHFYKNREWPYKNVVPKLLAEQFMVDQKTQELRDYKFFCFNGVPKLLYIASDRQNENEILKFDFYDMDFNHLNISYQSRQHNYKNIEKPKKFEEMTNLAKILSKGFPHVRVDFYIINNDIYFGELTFYHDAGFQPFTPIEWDYTFGSYLKLPDKNLY